MQEYNYNNLEGFLTGWMSNDRYFDMLGLMAQLSRLFSESAIPYLDYRLTENLFCRYFEAMNDARSCTAYDARLGNLGIGIKTFILSKKNQSVEKIAEFNKLKKYLNDLTGIDLARQISIYRNERIQFANDQYDVTESQYHIIGRIEGRLRIFNTPYNKVDIDNIHLGKDDATSISFDDGIDEFVFNKSKSVLMKRFVMPNVYKDVDIDILEEPLELLEEFFLKKREGIVTARTRKKGYDYIMLPLYSRNSRLGKFVAEKSGLNQFNAGGRKRNENELYIPVPSTIQNTYSNFFPDRDTPFCLILPDGKELSAKICQDGGKALMSNPNSELGKWLLRKVLRKRPWDIVTIDDLNRLGFDSVCIEDLHQLNSRNERVYRISFADSEENYEQFIS